jgi:putative RNA ligase
LVLHSSAVKISGTAVTALHVDEVVPAAALAAAVEEGLVRVQRHPALPLRIFNYTELAVFSRTWTEATVNCRGLIVDDAGRIVARPWKKFFNHGEHSDDALDLHAPVEVTDKADGSLGIYYPTADGAAIATRGSFTSDQAQHATQLYRARYAAAWEPVDGWTYLFEIIYPANRIVLDYGSTDDLVLLGAVEIATGTSVGPQDTVCAAWPGPRIEVQAYGSLAEALAAEPRKNAEGLVVRYLAGASPAGVMVKLKQADYINLHRIVTGLTARRLWERSAIHAVLTAEPDTSLRRLGQVLRLDPADVQAIAQAGPQWLEHVRQSVPEEFLDWITRTTDQQAGQVTQVLAEVASVVAEVSGVERKEIAVRIAKNPHRGMVFAALDGRSILIQAWAAIRPAAERPFGARAEEVA